MKKVNHLLKRKITALIVLFFTVVTTPILAQLAAWNPSGLINYGPSPWAATTTNSNITVGGWTRGSGVGSGSGAAANAWGGNNWGGASNQDATFTITSNPGSVVSYSTFNLYYRRSSTGPASGTFEYTFGNSTTYTVINTFAFNSTSSTGALHAPISLSSITNLQNVSPGTVVKFRIFPTPGTNSTTAGTWYIFSSGSSITGTISGFDVNIAQTASINCHGQSTGALSANVSGSIPPYTYSWMPSGSTSSVISNLSAGVYTCFVTSSNSETTTSTFTLTQPAVITPTVMGQTNILCGGSSNGSATVSVSGGTPVYTYSWLPSGGTGSVGVNLAAGNYTLNVSDVNNCSGSQTISITQPQSSLNVSASNSLICNGSTVSVNALGANTYTWSNGISNGVPFSPTLTATYTVNATNTVTGCTDSNTLSVAVNPSPTISAVSNFSTASVCNGSSITLNASGANTYTWSGSISNGVAFSPSVSSTYSVAGTDTNNCTGSTTISVTVILNPTVIITSSKPMLCKGETSTLTASGALTYSWSTNSTTSLIAVSPTVNTIYSLTGKDGNGCVNTSTLSQKVSGCSGIETFDMATATSIVIFPNPNAGEFTIRATSDLDLLIINELGQTLQTLKADDSNNRELQVKNLESGIYFILSKNTGLNVKQKIVVTR